MALPLKKETNQPNLNTGLGSIANNNTPLRPANDNTIPQNLQMQSGIANRLAAERASKSAEQRIKNPIDEDYEFEDGPQNDNGPDNFNSQNQEPEKNNSYPEQNNMQQQNLEAQQQESREQQIQLDEDEQREAALMMAMHKQSMLAQIQKQNRNVDKEVEELVKELRKLKQSSGKLFLHVFQPQMLKLISDLIDDVEKLNKRIVPEKYQQKIIFLKGALITADTLIGLLKDFRFTAAFLDAAILDGISWLKMIVKTIETIVIPIIIIIIAPLYIPFLALLFYIGRFPLLKGTITKEVITLLKKLKRQKEFWEKELEILNKIVTTQKQKKSLKKQAKQLQRHV